MSVLISHSVVSNSVTPWTVACQAPLSMEFSRQIYWSGLPLPSSGDLPDPGIEPTSASPALHVDSLPLHHLGSPILLLFFEYFICIINISVYMQYTIKSMCVQVQTHTDTHTNMLFCARSDCSRKKNAFICRNFSLRRQMNTIWKNKSYHVREVSRNQRALEISLHELTAVFPSKNGEVKWLQDAFYSI